MIGMRMSLEHMRDLEAKFSRSGQHLIYKHAIAQLVSQRSMNVRREGDAATGEDTIDGSEATPAASESTQQPAQATQEKHEHRQHQRPQGQHQQHNRPQQNRDERSKPKKDGFNTIDLSNVKIGEEQTASAGSDKS